MSAKVVKINNHRIFLTKIRKYKLSYDSFYYRNNKQLVEKGFFKKILADRDQLWSKYRFKYLYIEMYNGEYYCFVSDSNLNNLLDKMYKYFEDRDIHTFDDIYNRWYRNERMSKGFGDFLRIRDTYEFIHNEDISDIINRIDRAFECI